MIAWPDRRLAVRTAALALAATFAAGAVACAGEPSEIDWPEDPSPAPDPAQPSPTLDPTEAAAVEEILALVDGYREAELGLYAVPQPPPIARRELAGYLADPLLAETLITVNDMRLAGVAFEGRPVWRPAVADLRLDETPPAATVRDCVDASGWQSVFQESGEPVPGDDRPARYVARLELKLHPDGWLVYEAGVEEGAEC